MAKRLDKNDATMEVSASQLVPERRPPVPHQPGVAKNDASMWIGNVVGTADFAPVPAKRRAGKRGKLVVGLVTAAAVAGGGGYAYYAMSSGSPAPAASSAAPAPPAKPVTAATPVDAAVAVADATAPAVPLDADAVSGADPLLTKAGTRPKIAKKRVQKKKIATSPKRRK